MLTGGGRLAGLYSDLVAVGTRVRIPPSALLAYLLLSAEIPQQNMNWKIIFLAAIVLASGCIGNSTDTTPEDANPADETSAPTELNDTPENVVRLTGSGFSPQTITVEQGETVTWINEANGVMWVGSDVHPTHTEYAGTSVREHCQNGDQTSAAFDQCSTGDQFSFTFEKTGEWGYHNHVSSSEEGTVIVE